MQDVLAHGREVVGVFDISQGLEISRFPFLREELIVDAH
jgi:hypothetical protein